MPIYNYWGKKIRDANQTFLVVKFLPVTLKKEAEEECNISLQMEFKTKNKNIIMNYFSTENFVQNKHKKNLTVPQYSKQNCIFSNKDVKFFFKPETQKLTIKMN